ncbi:hypothetical protein Drorol1_Dr00021365, partial [Drosera rotundifolia]
IGDLPQSWPSSLYNPMPHSARLLSLPQSLSPIRPRGKPKSQSPPPPCSLPLSSLLRSTRRRRRLPLRRSPFSAFPNTTATAPPNLRVPFRVRFPLRLRFRLRHVQFQPLV